MSELASDVRHIAHVGNTDALKMPAMVVRAGEVIEPHRRLLRDVCETDYAQAAE